jgi:tetratricopeptide (TPR) repeat protein
MRIVRLLSIILAAMLAAGVCYGAPMSRSQALKGLEQPEPRVRLEAIGRLADIGRMEDANRLVAYLDDDDEQVRTASSAAIWLIWSRSGDPAIDALYARGVEQMQASDLDAALATFSEIVRRKPEFAEGWNKRATVYFLLGQNEKSLLDCDEVLKRNPNHFGALAGAGQIHLQMGNPELALKFFQRAVEVNPNLEGPAQAIPMLENFLSEKRRNTT